MNITQKEDFTKYSKDHNVQTEYTRYKKRRVAAILDDRERGIKDNY